MERKNEKEKRSGKINWISAALTAAVVIFCALSGIQAKTGRDFGIPALALPQMGELGEFLPDAAPAPEDADPALRVNFLDVGQAKCILIQAPEKTVLIDAGDNATANAVVQKLKSLGAEKIDLAIGTHPHADHIGGMDAVIMDLDVREVLLPEIPDELVPTTATYRDVLEAIDQKGLEITVAEPGQEFDLGGGAALTILGPVGAYDDLNDWSVVARLDFGSTSFLFTGDASKASEEALLNTGAKLPADVLDIGHHGSDTATTAAFLKQANPSIAVISCGTDNSYGHPHRTVMERLEKRGIDIYRTDIDGRIAITSDGKTLSVETGKE